MWKFAVFNTQILITSDHLRSLLIMLSSIRRALTPSPSHANDKDLSKSISTSPAAPNHIPHDSSHPSISPLEQVGTPHRLFRASNSNEQTIAAPQAMNASPKQSSGSFLPPVRANDDTARAHYRSFSLDGPSDDHQQPTTGGAQPRTSPLPPTEPGQYTSKSHPSDQPLTQSENQTGKTSGVRGIWQPLEMANETGRDGFLQPPRTERVVTQPEKANDQLQNDPATTHTAKTSTSKSQPPKRKRGKDQPEKKLKSAKKQRGPPKEDGASIASSGSQDTSKGISDKEKQSMEGEGSTSNDQPKGAAQDMSSHGQELRNEEAPTSSVHLKEDKSSTGKGSKKEVTTNIVHQGGAAKDHPSIERASANAGEESSGAAQQIPPEIEASKKRGRPKKQEMTAQKIESQPGHKASTSSKRGRAEEEAAPKITKKEKPKKEDKGPSSAPKKRGRPAKGAEPGPASAPASVPTTATPKKRGRPKKDQEAVKRTKPQVATSGDTLGKRGRPRKKDLAEADEPQGSAQVEATAKKHGRPRASGLGESSTTVAPGKRGRPRKEEATHKGAKPTGVRKNKAVKKGGKN